MRTPAEEPEFAPWRPVPVGAVLHALLRGERRPAVVAVDGRSAGGKTTTADTLRSAARAQGLTAVVVHTDDIAWNHSFFDWADLLAHGVLEPLRRGEDVSYTPPGWAPHGRTGSLDVPAATELVLVEGVGAGRRELSHLLDAVVWVASDLDEAMRRGLDRDIVSGVNVDRAQATAFWHEWEAEELPFQADQRPWERASVVLSGTPSIPLAPHEIAVSHSST
jgi:hypothetical protein